ncbi:TonB-dependent receptor [Dasania sp. GY-MA-18]|uniref:TonB-dependent receptor n=1 Tax=Dasania phycosphaerae TaxID=2950436 RepID=A0A9J6RM31_9GAMM|nr:MULTISPECIES: TonB-dependent receptor [Dasania]MCR8922816.1 TonB-dependent receptor [Dasania sp. GY-MA-18]MCZ0865247.1 TonB-dependent receptor [Dasania phycosphaerae]MCZ0868972.1 TonB-dependent receptor [Dasania phycosphaerae]
MTKHHQPKARLNYLAATIAALAATHINPVVAEQKKLALEEVVVTARHKSESLQSTPVAVSAFSESLMKDANIAGLDDIAGRVPGFQMNAYNAAEPELFMRGIGSDIESAGAAAAIGIYIDGVYISRGTGATGDLFDLERVEVLRGPQGTLYGKNVVGGAVNFITKKPSLEGSEGSVEVTLGDYDLFETKAYYNTPLSDNVAAKVAGTTLVRDGYGKNRHTGNDVDDAERYSLRGQVLVQPNADLEIVLSADGSHSNGKPRVKHIAYSEGRNQAFISDDEREDFSSVDGFEKSRTEGLSLRADWNTDAGTFTSITAYRQNDYSIYENAAAGLVDDSQVFDPWGDPANNTVASPEELAMLQPDDQWLSLKDENSHQFSQEFRFASNTGDKIHWQAGAFFMREDIARLESVDYWFDTQWGTTAGNVSNTTDNTTDSVAIFGQITYDLSDKLSVTTGLRWSEDEKDFSGSASGRRFDNWDNLHEDINGNRVASYNFKTKDSWDEWTPSLTVDYQATDDVFLYFAYAKGYKAGGYNGEGMEKEIEAITPFEPETAVNHEFGFKTQWLDNRIQVNGAIFLTDYEDIQNQVWVSTGENTPDNLQVLNGSGEAKGAELEFTVLVTEQFSIMGSYGYLDAKFTDDLLVDDENLKGNDMRRSPEHSFNLATSYDWQVGDNTANFRIDYRYQDEYFFDNSNNPLTQVDSEYSIDASLKLTSSDDSWSVKLWGKNLTDELNVASTTIYAAWDDTVFNVYHPPRTYGVTFNYNF